LLHVLCQLGKVDEEINLSKLEVSQLNEDAPARQKKELKNAAVKGGPACA
jgi:hypothetical protein